MKAIPWGSAPSAASLLIRGVDAAPIGVAITDLDCRFLYANEALCWLLGRSSDELKRLRLIDVTHTEDRAADAAAHSEMLKGTLGSYNTEKRYARPDGTSVWVQVHVVPIHAADGAVEAFVAHTVDISEHRLREERLSSYVSDAVWLGQIRDALDDDRLVLYAQPIVDLRSGEVVQQELLLRMRDEDDAIMLPSEFLAVAERYGLIGEIDRWVIRQAVGLAAAGTPVQFNLSAASITNPDVLTELAGQIQATCVDPSLLVVEVTETAMLDMPAAGRALADELSALGCELALDDFGTGFATLSLLRYLPAKQLKIDVDFIRAIVDDETDQRLVRGIVAIAREFGLTTTAEGVDDPRAVETLKRLGVERGQGYLFARPAPLGPLPPPKPSRPRSAPSVSLATVRAAFQAFTERDLARARRVCHPALVLRPPSRPNRPAGDGVYRGHDGLARYFNEVRETWDELRLRPRAFWEADGAVIVAGEITTSRSGKMRLEDVLWVFRLRDGLIASMHMFDTPDLARAPITKAAGDGHRSALRRRRAA